MKLTKPSREGRKAEQALQKAVTAVIEENRKLGLPVAVMKNGRAVLLPVGKVLVQVREKRASYKIRRRREG